MTSWAAGCARLFTTTCTVSASMPTCVSGSSRARKAVLAAAAVHARSPQVHRLEATPATIVYGYYWSEAPPALRIASGDVIDVDTLLTNTPEGLATAGVPDDRIQTSLKEIVSQVTGD